LAIKEHPMTFEEIDARAIELFSKLRPIEEWPYIDEGDRNYWRKEAGDELDEPLPAEACRLAAPLERREPEPLHLVEEPPHSRVVSAKTLFERLDALAAKMTPTQIAEAQKLAREWKSSEQ
jgi:hypothetical protein